jgi:hypothetical protein
MCAQRFLHTDLDRGPAVILRRKQLQAPKWTPTQAGRYAVLCFKSSLYCEHGEIRISCPKRHVGDAP